MAPQLVYGASPEERAAWRLPDSAAGFAYLARSSCFELPGQSNAEEYQVGSNKGAALHSRNLPCMPMQAELPAAISTGNKQ